MLSAKSITVGLALCCLGYLFCWPVGLSPASWNAPLSPNYRGDFQSNNILAKAEKIKLNELHGPEDIAWDGKDQLYTGLSDGTILRISISSGHQSAWAHTGGRPLGMAFSPSGELVVADAMRGLLSISAAGQISVLTETVNKTPIRYADDVAIAKDGTIYFSDASTKFGAEDYDTLMDASLDDLLEHRPHGRILVYNPKTKTTSVLIPNLYFPNGLALNKNDTELLFVETPKYRVMKFALTGAKNSKPVPIVENLPGFPDNIDPGQEGRFWVGLVAPRDRFLDTFASWPKLRQVVKRIPRVLRPKPKRYGHVIAINISGSILRSLQDPSGKIAFTTGAIETPTHVWISSLFGDHLAYIPSSALKNTQKDTLNGDLTPQPHE